MRLLMTTDTVGGVWTFTRELTEGLLSQGSSVMLVSFGREPSADQSAWVDRTARAWPERFRFVPTTFALEWMQENGSFFTESVALLRHHAAEFRADLLHANQLCYGALAETLPTLVTAHSDVRGWFTACRGAQPEPSPWIERYDQIVGSGLRGADTVTAPTAWMLAVAEQHYGPFRKTAVVPNGRDIPASASLIERQTQAVTVGRLWDEGKDLALLEEVDFPMPLLVAGEASGPETASKLSGRHVTLLGQLSQAEVFDLFRRSSIYVVTSQYEPFGLAPLEAALCGCALVARDLPSLREVWGDAAIYFRDAAELSQILRTLSLDPELVAAMAQRANEKAQRCFGRKQMTERYLALYQATTAARTGLSLTERHVA